MKLTQISIKNFRCYDSCTVYLGKYCGLVGANGAGKSNVLAALRVFFRESVAPGQSPGYLAEDDFHNRDTSNPIEVTLTFDDLNPEAQVAFKEYYRDSKLVCTAKAVWDPARQAAEVLHHGERHVFEPFSSYFKLVEEKARVPDLREKFLELRKSFPEIDSASTKDDMMSALRRYEESHQDELTLIQSGDQFYGFSKGRNRLEKFVQWVYIPAVKEASDEEQETNATALGKLLKRTVRGDLDFGDEVESLRHDFVAKYDSFLNSQADHLREISGKIEARLQEWTHSGAKLQLGWQVGQKMVKVLDPIATAQLGEGDYLGPISRSGHGLQRAFLVTILEQLAQSGSAPEASLLLAIEEPELYQHPPQARHLAETLHDLTEVGNQLIVSTHSPYFVSASGFESLRIVRKHASVRHSTVKGATLMGVNDRLRAGTGIDYGSRSQVVARLEQILQDSTNEMFFSRRPILVEGREDIAYLTTFLVMSEKWKDFRRLGCHFIPVEGKTNMARPLVLGQELGIPVFCVFDADVNTPKERATSEKTNRDLLNLLGKEQVEAWPSENYFGDNAVMWTETIERAARAATGDDAWNQAVSTAKATAGLEQGIRSKNPMLVAAVVEKLFLAGIGVESLERACDSILDWAERPASESA